MPLLQHIVLIRFPPKTDRNDIAEIFEALDDLEGQVSGLQGVTGGSYESPEGLNRGFTHGYTMTFVDASFFEDFVQDPRHLRIRGLILTTLADPDADLICFDYLVSDRFRYA